nr:MAG TPA: hypothetical protein [Caudoviricetes sp.]
MPTESSSFFRWFVHRAVLAWGGPFFTAARQEVVTLANLRPFPRSIYS